MNLPVRIVAGPGAELPAGPAVFVDGSAPAGGRALELSHWPGHATPRAFLHELSTGCALLFAALPDDERERRAAGAVALVNNHYDTDGTCALFATRHPRLALARSRALLDAAASGDFFRVGSDDAFRVDRSILGLTDPARSPLELSGLADSERWQRATEHWMEHLPALLDGDHGSYRDLWEPELEALRADRHDLGAARADEERDLDLAVWSAAPGERSSRAEPGFAFDPGRHALFSATQRDRVLTIGASSEGTTYRWIASTRSWFDLPGLAPRPRGDLAAVVRRLNGLEGCAEDAGMRWRAQPAASPSPELWFGTDEVELFSEHNPALRPSRLDSDAVLRALRGA